MNRVIKIKDCSFRGRVHIRRGTFLVRELLETRVGLLTGQLTIDLSIVASRLALFGIYRTSG